MPEIAAVDGHEATVRILVEMGADPLSRVCGYHYKLLPAAKAGHLSAAPVILDHELQLSVPYCLAPRYWLVHRAGSCKICVVHWKERQICTMSTQAAPR